MLGPDHDLEGKYTQQQGQKIAAEVGCEDDNHPHMLDMECQGLEQDEEEEGVHGIDKETALRACLR